MSLAYTYYPGCSCEATSVWHGRSIEAVARKLDLEFIELEDWNCCGATAYMSIRELMSFCIAARNLALAEPFKRDVVTPCSACFTVLSKANRYFHEDPELRSKIEKALSAAELTYRGTVRVRHVLDVFANDVSTDTVRERTENPLGGLKVAPYYGCQIVRPETGLDNPDYPTILERLLSALGAEPVSYSLRTRCCGASLAITRNEVSLKLTGDLLKCAADSGAEAIATICPLCHVNLETQMNAVNERLNTNFNLPVLFFSQLMGVALGVESSELGLNKGFVDPQPLLESRIRGVSPAKEGAAQ